MLTNENNDQTTFHRDILNASVKPDHVYRKILNIVDFTSLSKPLESCYSKDSGISGYPIETALECCGSPVTKCPHFSCNRS